MVIPSIYCCHSCICSDNDFDFDFDSSDEEDNKYDKDDKYNEKTSLFKNSHNTQKTQKIVLYFYFKNNESPIKIEDNYILSLLKDLNLGVVQKTSIKQKNYVKITYKKLNTSFKKYYNKQPHGEMIVALFKNSSYPQQELIKQKITGVIEKRRVFYNIEHCVASDYIIWVSSIKPKHNEEIPTPTKSIDIKTTNNIIENLPSSAPIDIPTINYYKKNTITYI